MYFSFRNHNQSTPGILSTFQFQHHCIVRPLLSYANLTHAPQNLETITFRIKLVSFNLDLLLLTISREESSVSGIFSKCLIYMIDYHSLSFISVGLTRTGHHQSVQE